MPAADTVPGGSGSLPWAAGGAAARAGMAIAAMGSAEVEACIMGTTGGGIAGGNTVGGIAGGNTAVGGAKAAAIGAAGTTGAACTTGATSGGATGAHDAPLGGVTVSSPARMFRAERAL